MELKASVLNINYGHKQKVLEQSCNKEMELGQAIDRAIEECIEENALHDLLVRRRHWTYLRAFACDNG